MGVIDPDVDPAPYGLDEQDLIPGPGVGGQREDPEKRENQEREAEERSLVPRDLQPRLRITLNLAISA